MLTRLHVFCFHRLRKLLFNSTNKHLWQPLKPRKPTFQPLGIFEPYAPGPESQDTLTSIRAVFCENTATLTLSDFIVRYNFELVFLKR